MTAVGSSPRFLTTLKAPDMLVIVRTMAGYGVLQDDTATLLELRPRLDRGHRQGRPEPVPHGDRRQLGGRRHFR
jgi:hypothetical protein